MNGTVHGDKEYEQTNKQRYQMLDRTWKGVGHGREREVGDGRRGIRTGGETGKLSTYLDGM